MRRSGESYRNLEVLVEDVVINSAGNAVDFSLDSTFKEEVSKKSAISKSVRSSDQDQSVEVQSFACGFGLLKIGLCSDSIAGSS